MPPPIRHMKMQISKRPRINTIGRVFEFSLLAFCLGAFTNHVRAQQPSPKATQPPASSSQQGQSGQQSMQGMADMPGMNHDQTGADRMAHDQMSHMHQHMGAHMHMTAARPATPEDWARAEKVAGELRDSIEKYKDYRVAMADGFQIFLPNVPQPMYHFTNPKNGFLEAFTFDPGRPTSLLYKKTASGYELIGAMYTMSKLATEEQLNERVPLSVAQWHLHTNLCMPKQGKNADFTQFGLTGSIASKESCDAAGGRFYPIIFGWMVHVYPYEATREKMFEQ